MALALALQLCHHKIVRQGCNGRQSYNKSNEVNDLLDFIIVVLVAGKNLY